MRADHPMSAEAVDDPIEQCLVAVRGRATRVLTARLGEFSPLAKESAHVAAALGDRASLERHLDRTPALAGEPRDGWVPLAYVCGSPLNRLSARHSAGLLDCARLLLDGGADPNATTPPHAETSATELPVSIRAALNGNAAVAMLLRQRGAIESPGLRHQVLPQLQAAAKSNVVSEVVQEYFRRPEVREAMTRALAEWRAQHGTVHFMPPDLRELHSPRISPLPGFNDLWAELSTRFDDATANGAPPAHRLVRAGPAGLVELVLARGINPNLRDASGRTLLAEAVRSGNRAAADVLRSAGADETSVSNLDRWLGACVQLEAEEARRLAFVDPDLLKQVSSDDVDILVRAAVSNDLARLRVMLSAGLDPNGLGTSGATALHHAAWHGQADAVRLLVGHGASTEIHDVLFNGLAMDWAIHGAIHCRDADDEYRAVQTALATPSTRS